MDRFERLLYGGLGGSEGGEGGGASRRRHNERRAEGYGERRRERRKERHAVVERGSREVEPEGRRKEEREQIAGRSGGHGRRQASEGRTKGSKLEQSKSAHHRSSQSHGARKPAKDSKDDGFIKVGVLLVGDGVPPLDLACVDLLRLLGELDDIELDGEEMRGEDSGGKKGHVAESRAKETGKEDTSVKEQPQERKPAAEEVSMKEITVKEQPEGGKTAAEGILTKEIPVKEQPEGKAVMERPADEQIVAEEPWEVVAGEEPPAQQKATEELPGKTESGEVQDAEAKPLAEAPKTVLKSVSFAENGARLTLLRKYSGSSLDRVTKENTKLNSDCLAVINRAPRFKFYFIMETINGLHHKSVGVKMVLTVSAILEHMN